MTVVLKFVPRSPARARRRNEIRTRESKGEIILLPCIRRESLDAARHRFDRLVTGPR